MQSVTETYHVYLNYGTINEEQLVSTQSYEQALDVYEQFEESESRVELAYFSPSGEYCVDISNGGDLR